MSERLCERGPCVRQRFAAPAYPRFAALGLGACLAVAGGCGETTAGSPPPPFGYDARPHQPPFDAGVRDGFMATDADASLGGDDASVGASTDADPDGGDADAD